MIFLFEVMIASESHSFPRLVGNFYVSYEREDAKLSSKWLLFHHCILCFKLTWKRRIILVCELCVSIILRANSGMGYLFFFFLHIEYSACTPPRGWLNMWLIQHHESIELHKSQADLFKLQNQLCKTTEKVYNRCCQVGAWRRMDLPRLRCWHAPY